MFHDVDILHQNNPSVLAYGQRDVRQATGSLPVAESIDQIAFSVPWFKHDVPKLIERYAAAFKKVALQAEMLLR